MSPLSSRREARPAPCLARGPGVARRRRELTWTRLSRSVHAPALVVRRADSAAKHRLQQQVQARQLGGGSTLKSGCHGQESGEKASPSACSRLEGGRIVPEEAADARVVRASSAFDLPDARRGQALRYEGFEVQSAMTPPRHLWRNTIERRNSKSPATSSWPWPRPVSGRATGEFLTAQKMGTSRYRWWPSKSAVASNVLNDFRNTTTPQSRRHRQ